MDLGTQIRVPAGRVLSSGRAARQYVVVLEGTAEVGEGGATVVVLCPGEMEALAAVPAGARRGGENGVWRTLTTLLRARPRSRSKRRPAGASS